MRMQPQRTRVRVQHRHGAGAALELAVVQGKLVQRVPGTFHQLGVDHALVVAGQFAQLGRQGEGDEEVRPGHQTLGLALDPALALEVLAMRAVAVAAGVWHHALRGAATALGQHAGPQVGAAALEGGQGLQLAGRCAVLGQEVGLKALHPCGQGDHLTAPR